ncbi:hypothetical protein HYE82_19905 [Streptomyces sp. BR123]|uniref:hypothetical protein n=1 Tax=Streptomyces sp. BR123 TaxID=2749828 RepID=UPI0015C499F9|nr:hypothetical protein [Streptomyces sp. BR123]NXY96611.1 hypothetical protein [Streptomyces sp. BR123]
MPPRSPEQERCSIAPTHARDADGFSGIHGIPVVDFEIELAASVWIDGTAAMPKPDYAFITLTNVTADEAAVFARWLRTPSSQHHTWCASPAASPWPTANRIHGSCRQKAATKRSPHN